MPKFPLTEKVEVNGSGAHPFFDFLKNSLPVPADETAGESVLMGSPASIIWSPVRRSDVAWNFEKFLIGKDGVPLKRYSRHFETIKIAEDIEAELTE